MKEILELEYDKLDKLSITPTGKVNLLNNIIQFKLHETEFTNFKNDLSIDIKRYLNSLVDLAENGPRKYDIINENKINELLENVEYNDKINYINYLIRILEKSSFKDDIKKFQKLRYKTILKNSIDNHWSLKSICNIIIYFPLLNIYTLTTTLLFIVLIANLILLPAPFKFMEFLNYKIEFINLSENYFLNHFTNVTSALIGVNNGFKITPLNIGSMILLVVGKIFIFAYVVSLIFNKLTDLIKR